MNPVWSSRLWTHGLICVPVAIVIYLWTYVAHSHAAPVLSTPTQLLVGIPRLDRVPSPFASDATSAMTATVSSTAYRDYAIAGLSPNAVYEARVSYVGTIPYACTVRLLIDSSPSSSKSRKLLDVEKVVFSTDTEGRIQDYPHRRPIVRVSWQWSGITDEPDVLQREIVYTLTLEHLWTPGIPNVALKVGCVLVLLLFATYQWIFPYFKNWTIQQRHVILNETCVRND